MAAGRKIIIAVDESETSAYAFAWAITNFTKETDRVLILTSQTFESDSLPTVDLAAGGEYAMPAAVAMDDKEQQHSADKSKALVDKFMKLCAVNKVACEGEVVQGDPGIHICEEATRIAADVIIVGSHGHGILKRTLIGSISDYVLHHSPVPVIIVRSTADPAAHEPLMKTDLSRKIVVAVDESTEAAYAFTWALQNVCLGGDHLMALHVQSSTVTSVTSIGIDQMGLEEVYVPPAQTEKEEVQKLEQSEELVEKFMKYAAQHSKVHCEGKVVQGSTEERLVAELSALSADAVVVGTHDTSAVTKTFLGSVSDYLAHNSPCPVIVAKIPKTAAPDVPVSDAGSKQQ